MGKGWIEKKGREQKAEAQKDDGVEFKKEKKLTWLRTIEYLPAESHTGDSPVYHPSLDEAPVRAGPTRCKVRHTKSEH